jgi:sodium transport system permease protein
MDLHRVGIVYRKEILEAIRDRRTIIATIVIPIIIFPLIFVGFYCLTKVAVKTAQTERSKIAVLGQENAPHLMAKIRKSESFAIMPASDFRAQIGEKKIRLALEIPPGFEPGKQRTNAPAKIVVYYHPGEFRSQVALRNLQTFLQNYRDELVSEALDRYGVPRAAQAPFEVTVQNAVPPREVTGNLFGALIPYMIIFLTFVGCMPPALDVTVGEKERGTMETILTSPVGRTELALGKFFVVMTISSVTTIMALFSNAMTLLIMTLGMRDVTKGAAMPLEISSAGVIGILIMIAPLTITFAAGQIAIAMFAGNYREAQSYLSPLMIMALLPALTALLPGFDINARLAFVPILNVCLISREILSGTFHWGLIGIVFISSCVYAAAALAAAIRVFKSETMLFRT